MNTHESIVWTTHRHVTRQQAARIDAAVREIDKDAGFVRYYAAGNPVHGWIVRPNDGWNASREGQANIRAMAEAALAILSPAKPDNAWSRAASASLRSSGAVTR